MPFHIDAAAHNRMRLRQASRWARVQRLAPWPLSTLAGLIVRRCQYVAARALYASYTTRRDDH